MSTGRVDFNANERVQTEAVFPLALVVQQADLAAADNTYVVSPVSGYIDDVYSVVEVALTTAKSTITVKTAAGTVGTFEIAHEAAIGDVDSFKAQKTLANTYVAKGATIELENDAAPGTGRATFTIILKEQA